jgi:hypothetical protein
MPEILAWNIPGEEDEDSDEFDGQENDNNTDEYWTR